MRVLAPLPVVAAALALAPAAWAPPPAQGVLVPGASLAGVGPGMTRADVRAAWGDRFGVCRICERRTWLFNFRRFEPEGAGVVFRQGRVAHVFTHWRPPGWRTADGLELGAGEAAAGSGLVILEEAECDGYTARVAATAPAQTVFYLHEGELWGFGLVRPGADPCL